MGAVRSVSGAANKRGGAKRGGRQARGETVMARRTQAVRQISKTAWLVAAAVSTVCAGLGLGWASAPPYQYDLTAPPVIHDTKTNLTWSAAAPGYFAWTQGVSYCASLATSGGGWRLPSLKELLTLVDVSKAQPPAIDTVVFSDLLPDAFNQTYWTSTALAANPASAWGVAFADGSPGLLDKLVQRRVRCVR